MQRDQAQAGEGKLVPLKQSAHHRSLLASALNKPAQFPMNTVTGGPGQVIC